MTYLPSIFVPLVGLVFGQLQWLFHLFLSEKNKIV